MRRRFLKFIGFSALLFFLPLNKLIASTKKIFNKKLTDEQKNVMFNEGTERPFSSELNKEKRNGFYHCANCDNKLFASTAKFDSGTGWPSFTEALPIAYHEFFFICFAIFILSLKEIVFESLRSFLFMFSFKISAHEITGPAKHPLPTSSTPAKILFTT